MHTEKKNKAKEKLENENGSNISNIKQNLRCINIDCAFNSSLNATQERNLCNHPNVKIESTFAEITVAICSEFRSKKDYKFKKPSTLIELKSNKKVDITPKTPPEIITTAELTEQKNEEKSIDRRTVIVDKFETPTVVETKEPGESRKDISEIYNLTDNKYSDFLILKRLYQPYLKKGIIVSIIFHIVLLWLFYAFFVSEDSQSEIPSEQRIVVVEDIETPKFEPPDLDKKEEPIDVEENIRPKITPKKITPKIRRPKTIEERDTTSLVGKDTASFKPDSLLAMSLGDTTRLMLPDSLKNTFAENEVGMSLWYPKDWKLRDSRSIDISQKNFTGVIINTDSLSEDPGAVTMFILLEDDKINSFNKTIFKNTFELEDTMSTGFSTETLQTGAKKISYKFYIFAPTAKIYINTEIKKDLFEKYRKYIEAIVRSIKIIKKEASNNP
ncbi:MAG: hypothetical protein ACRDFC_06195 [Ignavibacteria bacterium]